MKTKFAPSFKGWVAVVNLLLDYSMQHSMHISSHSLGITAYIQVTPLWEDVPNFCGLVTKRSKLVSARTLSSVVCMKHSRCMLRNVESNVVCMKYLTSIAVCIWPSLPSYAAHILSLALHERRQQLAQKVPLPEGNFATHLRICSPAMVIQVEFHQ